MFENNSSQNTAANFKTPFWSFFILADLAAAFDISQDTYWYPREWFQPKSEGGLVFDTYGWAHYQ